MKLQHDSQYEANRTEGEESRGVFCVRATVGFPRVCQIRGFSEEVQNGAVTIKDETHSDKQRALHSSQKETGRGERRVGSGKTTENQTQDLNSKLQENTKFILRK